MVNRVFSLVTVAAVLLVAWYAGREQVEIGVAVAILGLALAYSRRTLAIPAAIAMAAAALYLPGVVAVVVLGGLLVAFGASGQHRAGDSVLP